MPRFRNSAVGGCWALGTFNSIMWHLLQQTLWKCTVMWHHSERFFYAGILLSLNRYMLNTGVAQHMKLYSCRGYGQHTGWPLSFGNRRLEELYSSWGYGPHTGWPLFVGNHRLVEKVESLNKEHCANWSMEECTHSCASVFDRHRTGESWRIAKDVSSRRV